ncbi:MAG: hypothetical protein WBP41_11870 [Saprospiraceae bacterium]
MRIIIFYFLIFLTTSKFGQSDVECYVNKSFLIIQSTRSYETALTTAKQASSELGIELNLRDLIKVDEANIGLSLPADTCIKYLPTSEDQESTCYIARGRYDDGIYVSVEFTNPYQGFTKGNYIVMVGSGPKNDPELTKNLAQVRTKYSDAYIKTSEVYMCCIH